jgi:hypothetical protein
MTVKKQREMIGLGMNALNCKIALGIKVIVENNESFFSRIRPSKSFDI